MHTNAKHYFEVVRTRLGVFRAVKSRFSVIFHGFARFWEPRPAQLALRRPRPAELPPSSLWARIWKIFKAQSKDLEDFSSSEQGFGRFFKLRARIWKIFQESARSAEDFNRIYWFFRRFPIAGEVFDRLASLGPIEFLWNFLIFLDCGRAWPEAWRCGSRWISIKILWKNLGKFEKEPWKYRKPSQNNAY